MRRSTTVPITKAQARGKKAIPIVSNVVPFWGYLFRILSIILVKTKKGTTMETLGKPFVLLISTPGYVIDQLVSPSAWLSSMSSPSQTIKNGPLVTPMQTFPKSKQ